MKNQKTETAKKIYLKGHEPRTVHLEKMDRTLTTSGLTKQDWDPVKKKFKPEDKETAKTLLSI